MRRGALPRRTEGIVKLVIYAAGGWRQGVGGREVLVGLKAGFG